MIIDSPSVQHPVHLLSNLNQIGAVQVRTSDGILLQVHAGLYRLVRRRQLNFGDRRRRERLLRGIGGRQAGGNPHSLPFLCTFMKIFIKSILGVALLAGGASFTIHGQGFSGSLPGGQVSTNGVVRQPRDPAAEIAFNPFLQLKTNAQGKVLFDYQYRSTNAAVPLSQSTIEIHSGGATGRNGRHTVHFRANLKEEDAIVIVMPDNQILQDRKSTRLNSSH